MLVQKSDLLSIDIKMSNESETRSESQSPDHDDLVFDNGEKNVDIMSSMDTSTSRPPFETMSHRRSGRAQHPTHKQRLLDLDKERAEKARLKANKLNLLNKKDERLLNSINQLTTHTVTVAKAHVHARPHSMDTSEKEPSVNQPVTDNLTLTGPSDQYKDYVTDESELLELSSEETENGRHPKKDALNNNSEVEAIEIPDKSQLSVPSKSQLPEPELSVQTTELDEAKTKIKMLEGNIKKLQKNIEEHKTKMSLLTEINSELAIKNRAYQIENQTLKGKITKLEEPFEIKEDTLAFITDSNGQKIMRNLRYKGQIIPGNMMTVAALTGHANQEGQGFVDVIKEAKDIVIHLGTNDIRPSRFNQFNPKCPIETAIEINNDVIKIRENTQARIFLIEIPHLKTEDLSLSLKVTNINASLHKIVKTEGVSIIRQENFDDSLMEDDGFHFKMSYAKLMAEKISKAIENHNVAGGEEELSVIQPMTKSTNKSSWFVKTQEIHFTAYSYLVSHNGAKINEIKKKFGASIEVKTPTSGSDTITATISSSSKERNDGAALALCQISISSQNFRASQSKDKHNIPCKFFASDDCWGGARCPYKHQKQRKGSQGQATARGRSRSRGRTSSQSQTNSNTNQKERRPSHQDKTSWGDSVYDQNNY